jgi:uncharacterized protein
MDKTMLIDIDNLPVDGLRLERDFDFMSADLVEENAVFLDPARAEVEIRPAGDGISVKGRIAARLSFVCSRCLAPFEYPIDSRFDLVFLTDELDVLQDELSDVDMNRLFLCERRLDLRALVLEQLNLSFPGKPLCDEACQGLCAVCGELIGGGGCSCSVEESDPRLLNLKRFQRDKS